MKNLDMGNCPYGVSSSGYYESESKVLLMGQTKYPKGGHRPIDLRNRINYLLELENKYTSISKIFEKGQISLSSAIRIITKLQKDLDDLRNIITDKKSEG